MTSINLKDQVTLPQEDRVRVATQTIHECVTWLALNQSKYQPEFLSEMMAFDLLGHGEIK